jgi:DNA-binding PadR family transcriptional regulator
MSISESELLTKIHGRIVSNFLDLSILLKLRNDSLSDQDIISYVSKRFNVVVSLGTIYSCLHHLEEEELIKAKWGKKKKVYTLTEKGEQRIKTLSNMSDKILGLVINLFIG